MPSAPIAVFVYKRPEETRRTLEALTTCEGFGDSELFIFCDAARRVEDVPHVEKTRNIVRSRRWTAKTTIVERTENLGLAKSIIEGVGRLTRSHGRVIVFEDDLLPAPATLTFLQDALERYQACDQVMQVSAHIFQIKGIDPDDSSFFLPFAASWGWATWQRAWAKFDPQANGWERLLTDAAFRHRFDADGSYYYTNMLTEQMTGKIDSWLIRWRWSMFVNDGLTLFPTRSLVRNIGFGADATHTKRRLGWLARDTWSPEAAVRRFPSEVRVDEARWNAFKRHFKKYCYPSVLTRILVKIDLFVSRLLRR